MYDAIKTEIMSEGEAEQITLDFGHKPVNKRNHTQMREQRETLIAEVHARPELWDSRLLEFGDPIRRKDAWQEVADIVGKDVKDVTIEFRHLRDTFSSNLRAMQKSDRPRKWAHFDQMSFLIPVIKPRSSRQGSQSSNISPSMAKAENLFILPQNDTSEFDSAHSEFGLDNHSSNHRKRVSSNSAAISPSSLGNDDSRVINAIEEHDESNDDEGVYPSSNNLRPLPILTALPRLTHKRPRHQSPSDAPTQVLTTSASAAISYSDHLPSTSNGISNSGSTMKTDSFLLKTIGELVAQNEDTEGCFGKSVAASLRKLPESSRNWAMFKMQEVLYEASRKED